MSTDPWWETDLLAALIAKKLAVLEQLRDLARRQSDVIADDDVPRLLAVLSAKQRVMTELQKIQKQLEPFRRQDPEARRWRGVAERQRCRQLAERSEALLGEIMLMEKQSESEMIRRRDTARTRLEALHSSAAATRAYIDGPGPPRSTLDICSDL
jgi:hypothetical protein